MYEVTNAEDSELCRLCLTDDGSMSSIYKSGQLDLVRMLRECTSIQIEPVEGVPMTICEVCKSKLIICYQFVQQCKKTEARVREIFAHHFELAKSVANKRTTQEDQQMIADELIEVIIPCAETELKSDTLVVQAKNNSNDSIIFEIVDQSKTESGTKEDTFIVEVTDANSNDGNDKITSGGDENHAIFSTVEDEETSLHNTDSKKDNGQKIYKKPKLKKQSDSQSEEKKSVKRTTKKECPICGVLQLNLKQHMHVHLGTKNHVCQYCNKAFSQRGNLTCHLNIHTGNKPHKCTQCDKSFGDPTALKMHKVIHSNELNFKCEICGKDFKYRHSLQTHIRSHNDDRRHSCTYCDMAFVTSSSLKKHVRKHTGERPYKCEQCSKCFTTAGNLLTHRKSHARSLRSKKQTVAAKQGKPSSCLLQC
ncbi:zinc finger protein 879-like [Wyeomyia smithii]|uniref:zinc finger protein 879-like n=1 Tax=Wyeomyia smithii TaxID=174621 RepID=UPI002467F77F|nr:zinc finger protein 879-like [Wyeomyia smithii]